MPPPNSPFFADLSHDALIAVTGDDAAAFLHGQFTNDVQALEAGRAQWNGWCTAKGRLLATFLLARRPDGYLLMLPAEIAPGIAKRLAMFVLRSKVKIRDASAEFARFGLAGSGASAIAEGLAGTVPEPMRCAEGPEAMVVVALGGERFVILVPAAGRDAAAARLASRAAPANAEDWERTSILAGIPTIVAATQEAFVPQMANLDLVGALSFRKGCYPGQEIVARTQYRGILKRRMAIAHVQGAIPHAGQGVYSTTFGDQAAGSVVNAAAAPDGGHDLLVVAQIESLGKADLRLGSPEGAPIEIRSQPAAETAPR